MKINRKTAAAQHSTTSLHTGQPLIVVIAAIGVLATAALATMSGGAKLGAATLIGAGGGVALYHASFGFTGAWRTIISERRGGGLRMQALLLGCVVLLSFPLIAFGRDVGYPASGFVFPFGLSAAVGAFMFGAGMQFGAGCGSGTLFTAGGGSTRMMIVLAAFVAGSVIATAHLPFWWGLPGFKPVSLITVMGPFGAMVLTLAALAAIYIAATMIERFAHGDLAPLRRTGSLPRGPWSPLLGVAGLAFVSIATLLVLGRPWGITSGFALWGGKILYSIGVPIETWPYWTGQMGAIERTVFADATSVMDFGVILGAMAAAGLAGRYAPKLQISRRDLATAVIGGLLMGYGARLSSGCNIGAYLGGIISGSAHGWWWLIFGFLGSALTVRLKIRLGIS